MTHFGQIYFNLLLNSGCSFIAGLLIIGICVSLFRIDDGRWKLLLYSLPFAKILWDLFSRGIPATSVVHTGINPLAVPPKHQTLVIGAGLSEYGPVLNLVFSTTTADGKQYSTSVADYLYAWLSRHLGPSTPDIFLGAIVVIAFGFVLTRLFHAIRFEIERRGRRLSARTLDKVPCGLRSIDVYRSEHHVGTPFTGGIWKPYICLPASTLERLTPPEQTAVMAHEIAHVKNWDLLLTWIVKLLGDLFWFVPGYRYLSRKIDRLREIIADRGAVRDGASAPHLASALLKLRDIPEDDRHAVLYSAFFRQKSLLKTRIENLLGTSPSRPPRFGWKYFGIRWLVVFWTIGAVTVATFGGNHDVTVTDVSPRMERFLKHLGLM